MHELFEWFFFKIAKVSGFLWALGATLGGLATGQAEVSYKFYAYSVGISLLVLIVARIEGHRAQKKEDKQEIEDLKTKLEEAKSSLHYPK